MPVSYATGGGVLTLDPVQQLGYEQVPVWDGPTYLYTIHRLHFRGTYNPATFSWKLDGPDGAPKTGFNVPGQVAPVSNAATRHFLMQPRGQLTYQIGVDPANNPVIALQSPTNIPATDNHGSPTQYLTDAANGPIPLHCNVVEVKGTKTFIVDWAIETYVNECFLFKYSNSVTALLSHRWTVEEDLDQDYFATRTIRGHAIFRSDRLLALGTVPDDYRAWLYVPALPNFQRTVQQTIASPDGTRLDYVLVDRERPFNLTPGVVLLGVTRIEAICRQGYLRKIGLEEATVKFGGLVGQFVTMAAEPSINDPLLGVREAIKATWQPAVQLALDATPRYTLNLVARVWGNRTALRANLATIAAQILATRIGLGFYLSSGSIDMTEDLLGKFVELNCNMQSGPIQGAIRFGANGYAAAPATGPEEISGVTQSLPTPNPAASYDSGTRETPYSAMALALAGGCSPPSQPVNRLAQSNVP